MKYIIAFLLASLTAFSATVTGPVGDLSGVAFNPRVEFWPLSTPFNIGNTNIVGPPKTVPVVNGNFSQVLVAGRYLVKFPPTTNSFYIHVPNDTATYSLAAASTNVSSVTGIASAPVYRVKATSADTNAGFLSSKLVAGSGVTITTNNAGQDETLTITSSGGSGDVTQSGLAAGSYVIGNAPTNVIYVSKNGSDSTGLGTYLEPYLTLTNAQQQATAGQLIEVLPGNYTTQNRLGKNGVNWLFHDGVTVTNLVSEIFGDNGVAITNSITGLGSFYGLWGAATSATLGVVKQSHNDSRLIFEAKYCYVTNTSTACIRIQAGFARISVRDRIWSLTYDGIWVTGPCDVEVECPEIYGAQSDLGGSSAASNSVEFGGQSSSRCYFTVRSKSLRSFGAPVNAGGGANANIFAGEIIGFSDIAVNIFDGGSTNGVLTIATPYISGRVYAIDQNSVAQEKWKISGATINSTSISGPTIYSDIDPFAQGGTLENCRIITASGDTYSISDGSSPATPTLVNISGSLDINKATQGVKLEQLLDGGLVITANSDDGNHFLFLNDLTEFGGSGTFVIAVSNSVGGRVFTVTDEGNIYGGIISAGTISSSVIQVTGGNVSASSSGLATVAGVPVKSGIYTVQSNSLALWPTAPLTRGDAAMVNSNGVVFILTSGTGLTWTSTNKIAP
jgi:hypothetical protein